MVVGISTRLFFLHEENLKVQLLLPLPLHLPIEVIQQLHEREILVDTGADPPPAGEVDVLETSPPEVNVGFLKLLRLEGFRVGQLLRVPN